CTVDVAALANERKQGIEEVGREERYRFLRSLGADVILTAHHKDDNAETVLFHLIRGCGLNGLCGMEPRRDDIGRPLLCVTKKEILAYCEAHHIAYKTDLSNDDVRYTRNRIRKEVIPLLGQINPNVVEALTRLSDSAASDLDCLEALARDRYRKMVSLENGEIRLPLTDNWEKEPAMARRLIRMAGEECGIVIDFEHTEKIRNLGNGKSLPVSKGVWVYRDADALFFGSLRKACEGMAELVVSDLGIAENDVMKAEIKLPEKTDVTSVGRCGLFDRKLFEGSVVFRTRQNGDYVILPNGNRKKLSDYFVDEKIPAAERDSVLLMASEQRILWVVGHRFFAGAGKENRIVKIWLKS
ncbi:MAG: tRNA lysidine(34) synthetase TilS, partial [Firmicutes bacterium]|nr:tRNA lysidine(34) synthetase TilS [Bacillota bacterium]